MKKKKEKKKKYVFEDTDGTARNTRLSPLMERIIKCLEEIPDDKMWSREKIENYVSDIYHYSPLSVTRRLTERTLVPYKVQRGSRVWYGNKKTIASYRKGENK